MTAPVAGSFSATTPGVPSGTTTDDIVVLIAYSTGSSPGLGGVAPTATGFSVLSATYQGRWLAVLWKRSTGPESGTYAVTAATSGTLLYTQAFRYSGIVKTGNPFRGAAVTATDASSTTTSASVTLTGLTALDVLGLAIGQATSRQISAVPSGTTQVSDAGVNRQAHHFYEEMPSGGSSGALVATYNNASADRHAHIFALIPGATPAQISAVFPSFTTSLTTVAPTASLGATLPVFITNQTVEVTGNFLDVAFPAFVALLNVEVTRAQVGTTFPSFGASLTVELSVPTELVVTLPKFRAALSGGVQSIVQIAAVFPKFRAAIGATSAIAPTWQEVVRSDEYLAAAQAATRRVSARVEMVDDNELVVAAIPITGGNVSCDSTVDERWAATITLGDSDLMPSEVTDLLHPLSGLRARIWWTLELPSGLLAEVPIGTYYSSAPAATNNGSFGLSVKLLDVTSRIRRNKWGTGDVTDLGGMTVSAALRSVFTNRAPRFTVQITDTTETLPEVYEVGQVGRDPLSDILAIADAASYVVYSDRMGGLVAEPRGAVDDTRTVLDLSVGPDCRMESIQRSLDETQLLNTVTVRSTSSEVDPPVYATVQDNDPASPLWVGNGFIYSDVIDSDSVTTEAQCRALATVTLAERRALIESVDAVHRSRPEIDPLNLIDVNEPKTGASGVYQLASWSIDLEPGSMQRSVLSDRRVQV